MPTAVLTPFDHQPAIELGTQWWKRVLPVGEINYKGRVLKFTRPYLKGLLDAFRSGAYDQVPFQVADKDNSHTNDPERTGGEIADMDLRDDGLYVRMEPNAMGDAVLTANPKLGVSARIVEGYDRADGKFFPAAIQHVLGTLDPRIPGLGAWQAIEAASDPGQVIDLTAETIMEGGGVMPELSPDQMAKLARLLDVPADRFEQIIAGMQITHDDLGLLAGDPDPDETEPPVPEYDDPAAWVDQMSDEEFGELLAEYEADAQPAGAGAALTAEAQFAIDLANARADEAGREVRVIADRLAEQDFMVERRTLADLGVPPYITDLARPFLEGSGHTLELANGSRVDGGQVMRKVLTEYARQARLLDLDIELGSPLDEPPGVAADARREARSDVVSRARAQMFGL